MKEELKTYKFTCDLCRDKLTVHLAEDTLPEGWHSKFEYDFVFHYCKLCVKAMRGRGEL